MPGRNLGRGMDAALALLLALGAAGLAPLAERARSLGLFRGPGVYVLLVVAASVGLGRASLRRWPGIADRLSRARPGVLFLAATMVYAVAGLHYAAGLQVSGDEPHYLAMAQSLWRDHDLDLRNQYDEGQWQEFTPGPVRPHWGEPRADGRPFPAHSPGLPLLLAPAYAASGRRGCVLLVALLAAGAALVCRHLAYRLTGAGDVAFAAWLAALGPPLFFYSFHIYTEVPSALAAGGSLALLLSAPGPARAVVAAPGAAALPWLHVKMIPAAAALGLVAIVRLRGRVRAAFVLVAGAAAAAFALYYRHVFGVASPLALYGGLPADVGLSWRSLPGLLLDRSFGLLPVAPVYLVALAGMPEAIRRREAWPHALVGLAVLAPLLSWRMWWGGQCPPARFLVPLLPFLTVALALRLSQSRSGLARWWPALWLIASTLAAVAVADPGAKLLLNRGSRPTRLWAALSGGGVAIGDYLPSLTHASERDARVALVWVVAIGLLLLLDRLARSRPRLDAAFRSLSMPVAALIVIGLAIDVVAGPPPPVRTSPTTVAIPTPSGPLLE